MVSSLAVHMRERVWMKMIEELGLNEKVHEAVVRGESIDGGVVAEIW